MVNMSKSLRYTTILMLGALVIAMVGMVVDTRVITGVNAWIKPAKFAISTAIFSATMAWMFTYLTPTTWLRRLGNILSFSLVLEVGIIFVQAYRGTTSHFNNSTRLNTILFIIMGLGIVALWLATVGVFAAAMRQRFEDKAWGWALRLGLLITVLGSAGGGMMISRNAHTVGAPDGGPGLPFVGWSLEHGDLRIAHFVGLHAIQVIPFLAWMIGRRRNATAWVVTAAGGLSRRHAAADVASAAGIADMTPDQVFRICNLVALAGWIILIFFRSYRWALVLPPIFGFLYAVIVAVQFGHTPGGFGTLDGVAALFSNHWMLLAGWIHYLAFDLFVGSWEVRDAQEKKVLHLFIVPSLILTFLFGPAGLVLYLATRSAVLLRGRAGRP